MSARCMQKKFVFLLQRFALVVQEREYIRFRGFHLVFCLITHSGWINSSTASVAALFQGTENMFVER